jgi:hypothetical protein
MTTRTWPQAQPRASRGRRQRGAALTAMTTSTNTANDIWNTITTATGGEVRRAYIDDVSRAWTAGNDAGDGFVADTDDVEARATVTYDIDLILTSRGQLVAIGNPDDEDEAWAVDVTAALRAAMGGQ